MYGPGYVDLVATGTLSASADVTPGVVGEDGLRQLSDDAGAVGWA
jgi:hypothetical protein